MGLKSEFHRVFLGKTSTRIHNVNRDLATPLILGVDISVYFHQFLSHHDVIKEYHTSPRVPAVSFLQDFIQFHQGLRRLNCLPLYCFDGSYQPLKHATDFDRRAQSLAARNKLNELYQKGDPNDFQAIQKLRGQCIKLENDMLALVFEFIQKQEDAMYLQSPFEVEWQLV